ncbi:MAG: hypothetical protein U5N86_03260 [Planctomycetota bacterium]|nr:hypothetical protein [Planctomycetota bacterium]
MPAQYRGHWMKFDMFSVAGIAAGIVIAFSSILLALFFLYTGDIPEGSYSDALARKMAATVVILGLFSGLALAMLASALRSTARLLLPLPSPIRYDRQETFSHPSRSSSDNRSSRSRRRPQRRGGRRSSPGQNNRGSDRRSGQSRKSGGDSGSGQQGQQQQKKEEPPVKPMETNGSPVTFEDVLRHTNENGDSKSGNSSSNRRPRRGRRRSSRGSSQQKDKDSN